ncbi:hypothetical protein GQ457_13G000470 [Hibiscus cannabinus]
MLMHYFWYLWLQRMAAGFEEGGALFQVFGFSLNATSPECFIFLLALGAGDHKIHVNLCSPGDISWRTFEFNSGIEPGEPNWAVRVVYSNGVFYCVLILGELGAFNVELEEWTILGGPLPPRSFSLVDLFVIDADLWVQWRQGQNQLCIPTWDIVPLGHTLWLEDAFVLLSVHSEEFGTLMLAMMNGDERFVEPTPKSLQNLTLKSVKDAVMNQFVGDNMGVSIVGDFSEEEIESCILDYLGTIRASRNSEREHEFSPILFRTSPSDLQFQQIFLKDTDEKACASFPL